MIPPNVTTPAPLSAKFAVLRCLVAEIADERSRQFAFKIVAEIEQRARPLGVRLVGELTEIEYPCREWF